MFDSVLLIEDSTTDAHLIKRALQREQLAREVEWIADGEAALQRLSNSNEPTWGVVLLDIMLPKITGLEILDNLQKQQSLAKLPPIVMLSSSNQEKDIQKAVDRGAAAFMTKPDSYQKLRHTLRELFKQSLFTTDFSHDGQKLIKHPDLRRSKN